MAMMAEGPWAARKKCEKSQRKYQSGENCALIGNKADQGSHMGAVMQAGLSLR